MTTPTCCHMCKNRAEKHRVTKRLPQNHTDISRYIPPSYVISLSEILTFPSLICLHVLNPCYGSDGNLKLSVAKMVLLDSTMLTKIVST